MQVTFKIIRKKSNFFIYDLLFRFSAFKESAKKDRFYFLSSWKYTW